MKGYLAFFLVAIELYSFSNQDNVPARIVPEKEQLDLYNKYVKEDRVPINAIELKCILNIPQKEEIEGKEIFFRNLLYISVDDRGHVYAPDPTLSIIYEFNEKGILVNKIVKRGQGPGEMNHPQSILFHGEEIVVMDPMVSRLTYFDRNWKYIRSVSLFGKYYADDIDRDGYIYCKNIDDEDMISILDQKGKVIKKIGKYLFPNKRISTLNKFKMKLTKDGSIWVGYEAIGVLRKYSKEGDLVAEIDISEHCSEYLKNVIKHNYENEKKMKSKYSPVIKAITSINNDVIVTYGGMITTMHRFNREGKIVASYYIPPRYGCYGWCAHTISKNDDEIFYMLENVDGETMISLYGRGR